MNISRSTGYGMIAAAYIAQNGEGKPILSSEIAKQYNIPLQYLLKVMQSLVRAGILRGKRGPRGGFIMAKPASQITLLEIIESVEGPLSPRLEISELTKGADFAKKMEKVCADAAEQGKAVLEKAKLSQIVK